MHIQRLILVSNRLPLVIHADKEHGNYGFTLSAGGLATGLSAIHKQENALWIGWPGEFKRAGARIKKDLLEKLRQQNFIGVELSKKEIKEFYFGFSNGILWPLFHYLLDYLPVHLNGWLAFKEVNSRYAETIVKHYQDGDVIWIHDYQLMLVPGLVRQQLPHAKIGFFLHIPFPSYEIFRILPWREELIRSLLGADVIGFHTHSYLRHFANCLLRVVGVETAVDRCQYEGREIFFGAFPMGIDVTAWETMAAEPAVHSDVAEARKVSDGRKTLMAVDRLDYTKGIVRRLRAFELLLEKYPQFRGKVSLIQVAVPSRVEVPVYRDIKRQVEELVGKINGKFGEPFYQPIQYVFRSLTPRELTVLYRASDVMLVTPIRDGMNLVAKEFVAARTDEQGVLVLSEFAGAASELGEAVIVNPYNIEETTEAIKLAMEMDKQEQFLRMQELRRRVRMFDNRQWAEGFLRALVNQQPSIDQMQTIVPNTIEPVSLAQQIATSQRVLILCDYDGTLVPIVRIPKLAAPDRNLLTLIRDVSQIENVSLHIISGRMREDLEHWFKDLPVGLHAEHGYWFKPAKTQDWLPYSADDNQVWKDRIMPVYERFTLDTPGSFIEEKTCALAWHYRMSDPDTGAKMAKELRFHLHEATANLPINVLSGKKVIEVRHINCNKGVVLKRILALEGEFDRIIALGDDVTDEDLFTSLPKEQTSVLVGKNPSHANSRFNGPMDVRIFFQALVAKSSPRVWA